MMDLLEITGCSHANLMQQEADGQEVHTTFMMPTQLRHLDITLGQEFLQHCENTSSTPMPTWM